MEDGKRSELDADDLAFIARRVRKMVWAYHDEYDSKDGTPKADSNSKASSKLARFCQFDHVVCNIGGQRKWASGTVRFIDQNDPEDSTGQTKLPYVVKIDPPNDRLVGVPRDDNTVIRTQVGTASFPDKGSLPPSFPVGRNGFLPKAKAAHLLFSCRCALVSVRMLFCSPSFVCQRVAYLR